MTVRVYPQTGAGVKVVATKAEADDLVSKVGQIFFAESVNRYYGSESYVIEEDPTFTAAALVDADFEESTGTDTLVYLGALSADPATPASGTVNVFWDITSGNTLGSSLTQGDAVSRLKILDSSGTYSWHRVSDGILDLDDITFIGSDVSNINAVGDADIDTNDEVQQYLIDNPNVASRVGASGKIVVFATADNIFKVTAFDPGVPAAAEQSITSAVIVDADFVNTYNIGTDFTLVYLGSLSANPATPASGTINVFWDITSGNTLGSGDTAGLRLKFKFSTGVLW